jgi:hypothetical protein
MAPPNPTQRLNEIEPRLARIETALGLRPIKPKSTFSQLCSEIWQWIVASWKVLLPVAAFALAIISYFTAPWIKWEFDHRDDSRDKAIDGRITAALNVQGGIAATLAEVQKTTNDTNITLKTLQPFIQALVQREMIKNASLSQPDFGRNLPEIANDLAVARNQNAKTQPQVIDSLSKKMLQIQPSVAGYWPAVVQLVDYKYQSTKTTTTLPNCLDTLIPNSEIDRQYTSNGVKDYPNFSGPQMRNWMAHMYLGHCVLSLDDDGNFAASPVGKFFEQVKKVHPQANLFFLVMNDAHITYSGGKLLPVSEIDFTNCTFEFKPPATLPNKVSQSMTTQLLAANGSHGTIQLPNGL